MSNAKFSAYDRRSEPIYAPRSNAAPKTITSKKQDIPFSDERKRSEEMILSKVVDINLFLLIVFIGVPLLVYCVLSSAL